jgi:5-methylcytosine-specific restriction endonuclease McrA
MGYTNDRLNQIFNATDGCCHLCHKKLAFVNYGLHGARGAWHVEHSRPKAKGGTYRLQNLKPACIGCNLTKGTMSTKIIRSWNGKTRAPYNAATKQKIRKGNTIGGGLLGLFVGAVFGPGGAIVGASIGSYLGDSLSPKR